MERIVEQGFLYDFYGELLTKHQRQIYEDFVINNLSISEIAEEQGISRQGVHDLVKRCDKILSEYESKLHLVEKFLDIQKKAGELQNTVVEMRNLFEAEASDIDVEGQQMRDQLSKMDFIVKDILKCL